MQRACNVLRSVVSNSPVSIPSYALTKLRRVSTRLRSRWERNGSLGPREGLTGGQREREREKQSGSDTTFAHYIVTLVLRMLLRHRPGGISSLSLPLLSLPRLPLGAARRNGETPERRIVCQR